MQLYTTCVACSGTGKKARWFFGTKDCPSCSGKGKVPQTIITRSRQEVPRVAQLIKKKKKQSAAPAGPTSDDGDIVVGIALVVDALSSDRESAVESQLEEAPFKGGGGEGGGAGASGSWDKPEERAAEPEPVAEVVTASEPSEPASEPAASDSPSSSDSGSSDNT
ncbi:MAG: hypothetical protein NUV90_03265 [Candidatus Parcubacteria bacterium]|nr:hypothetical protein [Candidatus Parcubacteria bacterium]